MELSNAVLKLAFCALGAVEAALPKKFFDPHHHFFDTGLPWASYVNSLVPGIQYFPENYTRSVVDPIQDASVEFLGSVHVEALPDDGVEEVKWVQSFVDTGRYANAKAIVGSCDLSRPDVDNCLRDLKAASPLVSGVRWLLLPNHSSRVNGTDLLNDGPNGTVYPPFEAGYAALADHELSWDLQCLPEDLPSFFALAKRHPGVPVCINHLGRLVAWPLNTSAPNDAAISEWRANMADMATLPYVSVKISMLGHMVPDWITDAEREDLVRELVLETVNLFGPERCMVNTNWWLNAAVADSDGVGTVGPEPVEFLEKTSEWFSDYTDEEREWLYWKSAETFYLNKDDTESPAETTDTETSGPLLNILMFPTLVASTAFATVLNFA